MDRVRIEQIEGVAQVRMMRGEKHNALDAEQFDAIIQAGLSLRDAPGLRAVVLSGDGPSFCSGIDYGSFMKTGPDAIKVAFQDSEVPDANTAQACAMVWQELPVPVIAAVHGVAYGGGFQLAMGADIRFSRADARYSIMEIEYGLIPDMGITQTMRRIVALDVLKELTWSGRVFSGSEAAELGIVTHVCEDPLADATALATQIATRSPEAVRGSKQLFAQCWADDRAGGLSLEADIQKAVIGRPNQFEAVAAKMQKRDAKFADAG